MSIYGRSQDRMGSVDVRDIPGEDTWAARGTREQMQGSQRTMSS
jgi:hypothetical protein